MERRSTEWSKKCDAIGKLASPHAKYSGKLVTTTINGIMEGLSWHHAVHLLEN